MREIRNIHFVRRGLLFTELLADSFSKNTHFTGISKNAKCTVLEGGTLRAKKIEAILLKFFISVYICRR